MHRAEMEEFRNLCGRPERIAWAVAAHNGRRSICPLGWKMFTSMEPPMMAISVAPARFTHDLIDLSGEFVLAWPGEELADATIFCGTRTGADVDKFDALHLATKPGVFVKAPRIHACVANLECRVVGKLTSGDHTIFVGEIQAIWVNDLPSRVLCAIGPEAGYEQLLERNGYRFGVIKDGP